MEKLEMGKANREAFLNHLAQKSGRPRHQLKDHPFKPINDLPHTTLAGHNQDELLDIAEKNSSAVHVDFRTTDKAGLADVLNQFLDAKHAKHLLLPTSNKWSDFDLANWFNAHQESAMLWESNATRDENLDRAEKADAAIGFADYLLAESGTITVATTPGQGRAFNFLPQHYLSIIPKSHIVPRSTQAMDRYDADIKSGKLKTSNINFITGPSNSGDIEMVLVVGVHGPLDMTYVVVNDL